MDQSPLGSLPTHFALLDDPRVEQTTQHMMYDRGLIRQHKGEEPDGPVAPRQPADPLCPA